MSRIIPKSIKIDEEIIPHLKKYRGSFNSLVSQLLWLWVNDDHVKGEVRISDDRYLEGEFQPARVRSSKKEVELNETTVTQPLVHIVDEPVEKPGVLDEILPK